MAGLFTLKLTIPGATQFVATSPVLTFSEFTDINGAAPNVTARIVGYTYNVGGTATTARLVLTPPSFATGSTNDVILENRDGTPTAPAVNSFTSACGPNGIVVPRRYGIEAVAQPVPVLIGPSAVTYELFFSTTLKDAAGTLFVWYQVEGLDD